MYKTFITNQAVPQKNRTQRLEKAKILIIENSPEQGPLIETSMQYFFTEVELVRTRTREQALAYLEGCLMTGQALPLFIMLDLYLPNKADSWRLLEQLRGHGSAMSSLPVVMLSASDYDEDIAESYSRGVTSYLVKPVETEGWNKLLRALKRYWLSTVLLPDSPDKP
ncbi:response regulator [Larkinella insperata]|uniref:Response regulator n=1 Tax=Larkinella insperata TaxID=332158 RepID=A0ABW3PYQ7_9BACT|nr:response regulator [Larkinella insperata]